MPVASIIAGMREDFSIFCILDLSLWSWELLVLVPYRSYTVVTRPAKFSTMSVSYDLFLLFKLNCWWTFPSYWILNMVLAIDSDIVTTMFVGNFIGILCARSLHYQFYSWYVFLTKILICLSVLIYGRVALFRSHSNQLYLVLFNR